MAIEGTRFSVDLKKHNDKMEVERKKSEVDMTEAEVETLANDWSTPNNGALQ